MSKAQKAFLFALGVNQGLWAVLFYMTTELYKDACKLNEFQNDMLQLFDKKIMEHCPEIYQDDEVQTFMFNRKAQQMFEEEGL